MAIPVETFFLDDDAQGTLQARIQQMVAEGILSGRYGRGEKLPSSRKLAERLGVSRITVTLAYTELVANDYLVSKGRSGFFISDTAPTRPNFERSDVAKDLVDWDHALVQSFSGQVQVDRPVNWQSYKYPFIYGQTDQSLFDHANWRLCATRALGVRDFNQLTRDLYDQDDPELLKFIARQTLPRRGIIAKPQEILITMGAQNALWIAAQLVASQNRRTVIEDPCYPALRNLLVHAGSHVIPVTVGKDGLPPDMIPNGTDVIFTTPSHQCPTSATMPKSARLELLDRARALNALVVEDDYEFEMSFLGAPSPALKSLDKEGRVIYVGSFSKSLFPGLRLGYLVGSERFIQEARALRTNMLRHPPGHIQRTAAYFLSLGHYDALIRKITGALQQRRAAMEQAIAKHGLEIAGKGAYGGSSFWMRTPKGVDASELALKLREKDVVIESGAPFFSNHSERSRYYRLGYSSIQSELVDEGIKRIAQMLAHWN